jgi:hypothetical protein
MINTQTFPLGKDADQYTVAALRIFIFAVWAIRFAYEPLAALGYLDPELFTHHGLMILFPQFLVMALTAPACLVVLQVLLVGSLVLAMIGVWPRQTAVFALVLLTFTIGFMKGYGGHVNHRELTLLYAAFFLPLLPVYEVWAVHKQPATDNPKLYQFSVLTLCAIVVLQYVFVGLARLCIGTPAVFYPETMWGWILNRAMRMNPLGSPAGLYILETPLLKMLIGWAILGSTILELSAPLMFFCRKYVVLLMAIAFTLFHLAIYATMNILFLENILALALFFDLAKPFRPHTKKVLRTR